MKSLACVMNMHVFLTPLTLHTPIGQSTAWRIIFISLCLPTRKAGLNITERQASLVRCAKFYDNFMIKIQLQYTHDIFLLFLTPWSKHTPTKYHFHMFFWTCIISTFEYKCLPPPPRTSKKKNRTIIPYYQCMMILLTAFSLSIT